MGDYVGLVEAPILSFLVLSTYRCVCTYRVRDAGLHEIQALQSRLEGLAYNVQDLGVWVSDFGVWGLACCAVDGEVHSAVDAML